MREPEASLQQIAKHWTIIAVFFFFVLLRLPGLMALPLFNDEAVYLLRAQRFPQMLGPNVLSSGTLADGKLIQELILAGLALLPGDPLLWARLLSVACGLGTLFALARCGRRLERPGAGLLAGLLYAISPLAQIHDRLAISDSMLTMVGAFLLSASISYAQGERAGRREALGIGALIATAALVKLPGLLLAATPVLAVLFLGVPGERRQRLEQLRVSLIVALAALAALAPFHYGGAERQKIGVEANRLTLIGQNIGHIGLWLLRYLPGPLLIVPLAALAGSRRQGAGGRRQVAGGRRTSASSDLGEIGRAVEPQETGLLPPASCLLPPAPCLLPPASYTVGFLLAAGLALPAAFAVAGGSLASRYILPAWPTLLLATALGAQLLWEGPRWRIAARGLVGVSLGACVLWGGFFGLRYSVDPRGAPLDVSDRWQYIKSWTAGYGLSPLLERLPEVAAREGGITLANHQQPRLITMAGMIYLSEHPQIRMASVDLSLADAPQQLQTLAAQAPTYLLADSQVVAAYGLRERFPGLVPVLSEAHPGGAISFWLFVQVPARAR